MREAFQQHVNDDKYKTIGRFKGFDELLPKEMLVKATCMQELENAAVTNYIENTTFQGKKMQVLLYANDINGLRSEQPPF